MNTEQRARFVEYADKEWGLPLLGNHLCQTERFSSYYKCFMAAETPLLERIAKLEGQMADKSKLSLPAEELKELIYSIHGSHHVGDAQHTKLDIINAQIDSLYANGEPFVVKLPLSISVLISDGLRADFMLDSEVKAAITAAGGRCV
jgi:hypothetical protein